MLSYHKKDKTPQHKINKAEDDESNKKENKYVQLSENISEKSNNKPYQQFIEKALGELSQLNGISLPDEMKEDYSTSDKSKPDGDHKESDSLIAWFDNENNDYGTIEHRINIDSELQNLPIVARQSKNIMLRYSSNLLDKLEPQVQEKLRYRLPLWDFSIRLMYNPNENKTTHFSVLASSALSSVSQLLPEDKWPLKQLRVDQEQMLIQQLILDLLQGTPGWIVLSAVTIHETEAWQDNIMTGLAASIPAILFAFYPTCRDYITKPFEQLNVDQDLLKLRIQLQYKIQLMGGWPLLIASIIVEDIDGARMSGICVLSFLSSLIPFFPEKFIKVLEFLGILSTRNDVEMENLESMGQLTAPLWWALLNVMFNPSVNEDQRFLILKWGFIISCGLTFLPGVIKRFFIKLLGIIGLFDSEMSQKERRLVHSLPIWPLLSVFLMTLPRESWVFKFLMLISVAVTAAPHLFLSCRRQQNINPPERQTSIESIYKISDKILGEQLACHMAPEIVNNNLSKLATIIVLFVYALLSSIKLYF